jgi:hypothetical protein
MTRGAERVRETSFTFAWLFPALLSATIVGAVWLIIGSLDLHEGPVGTPLSGRLTWAIAAMLFAVFFVFGVIACNTVMFRCGAPGDALAASIGTTAFGLLAVAVAIANRHVYLGPPRMGRALAETAFRLPGVEAIAAAFDGFAIWAAVLTVTTACVIIKNEVGEPEDLSRQFRGSKILLYTSAALLIAGVAATGALHRWPAHEPPPCTPTATTPCTPDPAREKMIEETAVAVSTTVGTIFSMVLAAAYLPLGIVLRQRAYRVVRPWERTEAWLAIHGFALQPTQQLAKILLILSPLIAGGPVSQLVSLLAHSGQ